jgi:NADP-dependent 3-hydroxy acid dehydrogenase YdfG
MPSLIRSTMKWKGVEILVNNAGVFIPGRLSMKQKALLEKPNQYKSL